MWTHDSRCTKCELTCAQYFIEFLCNGARKVDYRIGNCICSRYLLEVFERFLRKYIRKKSHLMKSINLYQLDSSFENILLEPNSLCCMILTEWSELWWKNFCQHQSTCIGTFMVEYLTGSPGHCTKISNISIMANNSL